MFIAQVQSYRNGNLTFLFAGLCGEENDIHSLRLGSVDVDEITTTNTGNFTLTKEYGVIADAIKLNESERNNDNLLLHEFHKIAAMAQRNAISLTTASPFRTYYQAMIRNTGGRGSARQQQVASEVAKVLGSENGTLSRDMDRIVEKKCAVKIGGIFTLTARINHSCDPNAEVRGQEYADCNIDIVAKRTIQCGEELCISYVNLGSQPSSSIISRNRRRKELRSRYLFDCQCNRCI